MPKLRSPLTQLIIIGKISTYRIIKTDRSGNESCVSFYFPQNFSTFQDSQQFDALDNFFKLYFVVLEQGICVCTLSAPQNPKYMLHSSILFYLSGGFEADVLFIMDSSRDVSRADYKKQKDFVVSLVKYLRLSPDETRAALLTYGYTATLVANYGSYHNTSLFANAVKRASYIGGKVHSIF